MKARIITLAITVICLIASGPSQAKSGSKPGASSQARYIVVLDQPPLAAWFAGGGASGERLQSGAPTKTGAKARPGRLDVNSADSRAYLADLDRSFESTRRSVEQELGRAVNASHRYRFALNGFAAVLTDDEAQRLAAMPGIARVERDAIHKLHTDAGPPWIGADDIWNGVDGLPSARGEGIVIGVIDSGINWDHDSFADPGQGTGSTVDPYDHQNPFGAQLGLCSQPEVLCNDKLIGVYDFVTDDETTDEVEENNNGFDNDGHGTHVASIAAGNPAQLSYLNSLLKISGVAPHANLVTYRVCFIGDPDDPDDDGCQTSAILDAIDQAIEDEVDVINYSIGTDAYSPWETVENSFYSVPEAFLAAFGAGIFVATSAGNAGPGLATLGSPANAPWITAVGNSTHNRVFGNRLLSLSGGDTAVPIGVKGASLVGGSGIRDIVYAGDYGFPLCGEGTPELEATCGANTGATNPFAPGTFSGKIVVCDRGTYGRVEKGKNVLLAGAAGYILANTEEQGRSLSADEHCLPAMHITDIDGDKVRAWLDSGTGHKGSIGVVSAQSIDDAADQVSFSSSRGPAYPDVENVMKPNLIAPGTDILGAYLENYAFLSGTSMASPHVAGAGALLLSLDDSYTPSMLSSILETTATAEQAFDYDGGETSVLDRGAGRPRLALAAQAGLYLAESVQGFKAANPELDGDPRTLNLPGMGDLYCKDTCGFTRSVTAHEAGSWTASATGFPEGVTVTVSPQNLNLAKGASISLSVEIDARGSGLVGQCFEGAVTLASNSGMADQALPTAACVIGGDLPEGWAISSNKDAGWKTFSLGELTELPDLTLTSGGLVAPSSETHALPEDPTDDDPFDIPTGVFTVLTEVPEGTLWLHSETLESTARDLDLYVGLDTNGDGVAQESELICSSTSPDNTEFCEVFTPEAGTWWMLVQNWWASNSPPDDATLEWAVVGPTDPLGLTATAQGIVGTDESFDVRVAWNNVTAKPGQTWLGAVGIGTDRQHPNNVGVVPVSFYRSGVAAPATLPLMNHEPRLLVLQAKGKHDKMFIDVPPGADSLTVAAANGDPTLDPLLTLELHRVDFSAAFDQAPFATAAPASTPVASDNGDLNSGPTLTVSGPQLTQGRWYAVLKNDSVSPMPVEIQADISFSGATVPMHGGLWKPASRSGLNQGYEYTPGGAARAMIWYTYDEDHAPTWYLAATEPQGGNTWVGDLLRYTNDGAKQQSVAVGQVSITSLAEQDQIYSWSLFGQSGSDRMQVTAQNTCPEFGGELRSITGLWYRGRSGLGGASVLMNDFAHFQIHYVYDDVGAPRWLAAEETDGEPLALLQFTGDCPVCTDTGSSYETVGLLPFDFGTETSGSWTLDYVMNPPLSGDVNRTDSVIKLTDTLTCK